MSLVSLHNDMRQRQCDARNLYYTTRTLDFEEIYLAANREQQDIVEKLFWNLNVEKVQCWILMQKYKKPEVLTLKELRLLASQLHIKYYYIHTKEELLEKVREKYASRD